MFRLLKLDIIRVNAVPVEGTIDWDEEGQCVQLAETKFEEI